MVIIEPIVGSRVKAIVGKSIMVALADVRPGDVISVLDNESDPIVQEILTKENDRYYKLIYVDRKPGCSQTIWMDSTLPNSGHVFIHDLKNERLIHTQED